jgi:hypothetical protein
MEPEPMKKAFKQCRNVWAAVDFNVNSKISYSFSTLMFEEVDSAEIWATIFTVMGLNYPRRE